MMCMPKPSWIAAGACLLAPAALAVAQSLGPDPAAVMNEHLRRMEKGDPGYQLRAPVEPSSTPSVAPPTVGTVNLKEIQFSASAILKPEALRELGARYVGRPLYSVDLQAFLNDISALYREQGVLTAQPVLPQQNLGTRVMKVLLVEGRLGRVQVRDPGFADPEWVSRWFDLPLGEVVTNNALQRYLSLFNGSSDMQASAEFVPGERFGLTDLAIDVQGTGRAQFWSFVETQSAGPDLAALGVRVTPVGRTGGKFEVAALTTSDAQTLSLAEFWPIGTQGWRAGVSGSASKSRTKVPSQTEGSDLVVQGDSNALSIEVGRTWVLSTPWSLGTTVSLGTLRSRTSVLDERLFKQKLHRLSVSNHFNYATQSTQATVRLDLNSSNGEGRSFQHLDLLTQLQTRLDARGHWHGRANGFARLATQGNALASEQLILGGTDTVRGFDAGAASGDKGSALQLELRYRPYPAEAQPSEGFVFLDAGESTKGLEKRQSLASFGAGWQTRFNQNLGADLVWSRQIDSAQPAPNRWQLRLVGIW